MTVRDDISCIYNNNNKKRLTVLEVIRYRFM